MVAGRLNFFSFMVVFFLVFLAALEAPLIHIVFSFFIGWKEFMPFLRVPSLWGIIGQDTFGCTQAQNYLQVKRA